MIARIAYLLALLSLAVLTGACAAGARVGPVGAGAGVG